MIRQPKYTPGDHLCKCDRSGFTFLRSECRLEWTGKLVYKGFWEPKHPQLEIKSVKDDQSVRDARPQRSTVSGSTTTSSSASEGAQSVELSGVADISSLTNIGVVLDDGSTQWTFATADPVGSDVLINEPLRDDVASGSTVYVSSKSDELYIDLSASERAALL